VRHRLVAVDRSFRRLLRDAAKRQGGRGSRVAVAVVTDRDESPVRRWVARALPRASLTVVAPGDGAELHVRLAAAGPFGLIVDETEGGGAAKRARRLVFHLRAGGVLLLRRPRPGTPTVTRGRPRRREERHLADLAADVARGASQLAPRNPVEPSDDRERFGQAVRELVLRDGHVALVARASAYAEIREEQCNRLLELRPDLGRVDLVLPPVTVRARGRIRQSETEFPREFPPAWDVPEMCLREYHDVVSTPGQILTAGSLLLPDTYRHAALRRPRSRYVRDLAPGFADAGTPPEFTAPVPASGMRRLRGTYFYLDNEYRGHFGHLTTETVSRLWAWERAKELDPEVKALVHVSRRGGVLPFELDYLAAGGIAPEDIVCTDDPVVVERLLAPTPMFSNPAYAHPGLVGLWGSIGDRLGARAEDRERPRHVFVSRRSSLRAVRNQGQVEELFSDLGFAVVFPEDHPPHEQVRLFREAEVVAGFRGSGLFNLFFAGEGKRTLLVGSEAYTAHNEILAAGLLGHDTAIAWCVPEATRLDDGRWAPRSFQQPFTVDLDREGRFIRDVVGEWTGAVGRGR